MLFIPQAKVITSLTNITTDYAIGEEIQDRSILTNKMQKVCGDLPVFELNVMEELKTYNWMGPYIGAYNGKDKSKWRASRENRPYGLCHCHTQRRIGRLGL